MEHEHTNSENKKKLRLKKRYVIYFLLMVSILANAFFIYYNYQQNKEQTLKMNRYAHLDPRIADMPRAQFLTNQQKYELGYKDLKISILRILGPETNGMYGIYFEDLTSGAWIGINERAEFIPASLMKIPSTVAALKEIEDGVLKFDDPIILRQDELDSAFGDFYKKGAGYKTTIGGLINVTIKESDNTAVHALDDNLAYESEMDARNGLGIPFMVAGVNNMTHISPKDYSNIYKSLYFSNYLSRTMSEYLLNILSDTEFKLQIVEGVPKEIVVAHKIGLEQEGDFIHDCGIIYAKKTPYILCIMSKGNSFNDASKTMAQISSAVYNYVEYRKIT